MAWGWSTLASERFFRPKKLGGCFGQNRSTVQRAGGLIVCPAYEDFRGLFDADGQWIPQAWERAEAGMIRWIIRRMNPGGTSHNSTDDLRVFCHDGVVDAMVWFEAQKRQPNAFRVLRYAFKASLSRVIKRDKKTPRSVSRLGAFDAPEPGASDSASSFELNEDVQAFMRKLNMTDLCIFQSLLGEEHDQSEIARN